MLGSEIPAGSLECAAGMDKGGARLVSGQIALPMVAGLALALPAIGVEDADHARQIGIALDLRPLGADAVQSLDHRFDRAEIGAFVDADERGVVDRADPVALNFLPMVSAKRPR